MSLLLPSAPRKKPPQISPIFINDKVTLHVSREKDWKLHFVDAGWDDTKVRSPERLWASSQDVEAWLRPPAGGSDDPPSKTRTPLRPPWFFQL
jgi:hypothetical protein